MNRGGRTPTLPMTNLPGALVHSTARQVVAALLAVCATVPAVAQSVDEPRTFAALTRTVSQIAADGQVLELRVHWAGSTVAGQTAGAALPPPLALVEQKFSSGFLRRERRPQLSPDMLVIVVRASDGRELDWRTAPNPRVLRAETPGPDGRLSGQFFERQEAELFIAIPRLVEASALRVYQPRWTGTEYALDVVGDVALTPLP